MNNKLVEGIDYNIDQQGMMVLTKAFLLKRGVCCQSGCQNCPYGYSLKVDPNIPAEFAQEGKSESSESPDIYEGEIPEEFL